MVRREIIVVNSENPTKWTHKMWIEYRDHYGKARGAYSYHCVFV